MPGGAPPLGGIPSGGTGHAMAPGPMAGSAAQSTNQIRLALEMLQKGLPGLPMGSDLHTAVLKSVTELSKHLSKGSDDESGVLQQLVSLARDRQAQPQQNAMLRMFPSPGGPGGEGGGAPPPNPAA